LLAAAGLSLAAGVSLAAADFAAVGLVVPAAGLASVAGFTPAGFNVVADGFATFDTGAVPFAAGVALAFDTPLDVTGLADLTAVGLAALAGGFCLTGLNTGSLVALDAAFLGASFSVLTAVVDPVPEAAFFAGEVFAAGFAPVFGAPAFRVLAVAVFTIGPAAAFLTTLVGAG
jgi:hypothetical protein